MKLQFLVVCILLTGCSKPTIAPNCGPMRGGWPKGTSDVQPVNSLHLLPDGKMTWNGQLLPPDKLPDYLHAVGQMGVPMVSLTYADGTRCADVEGARDVMQRNLKCRSQCNEGGFGEPPSNPVH